MVVRFPQNCPFPWGSRPNQHPSPQPKRHVDRYSRFAGRTTVTDRPTDHATQSVTIGRIYLRIYCDAAYCNILCESVSFKNHVDQGQRQTMYSECPKFHPNRFTSGRVIAERVNTVQTRYKVFPIGARIALLWQHNATRNVSEYLFVLALCLVNDCHYCRHKQHFRCLRRSIRRQHVLYIASQCELCAGQEAASCPSLNDVVS